MAPHTEERPWWLLPPKRVAAAWWLVVATALLGVEYLTRSYASLPVLYVIPVCLAAWYSGRTAALTLAIGVTAAHLLFAWLRTPATLLPMASAAAIRGGVIAVMALWFARLSEHERALTLEVQTLKGLLPICSFCKSIRNDAERWEPLEEYVTRRSDAEFSHGVCPACYDTHYADEIRRLQRTTVRRLAPVGRRAAHG